MSSNRNRLVLPDAEPSEFVDKATLWAEADVLSIHRAMSNMAWVVRDVVKVLEGEEPTREET